MPHKDPKAAVDLILDGRVDVPMWPQMPALGYSEGMYLQTGEHLPGLIVEGDKVIVDLNDYDPTEAYMAILEENIDYYAAMPEHFSGLYELLGRDLSGIVAIKGQVTGPISEGLQVQDVTGRATIYDESYGEIVRKTVNMSARWQLRKLKEYCDNVVMFFDEPSLSLLGTPFASISDEDALAWINEAMEGLDCQKAIHCCGNTNWSLVLKTDIDILNFDAFAYGKAITLYPEEISVFLERGGTLAWGIVPNGDLIEGETPESLADILMGYIDDLISKGVDKSRLYRQSMITPQCGLGGTSEVLVDQVLDLLHGLSLEMRKRCGL
jgi:methionine synthase II (cobalamin-independent)